MRLIKAPNSFQEGERLLFLAGSIENGSAKDWQAEITLKLYNKDITILNPRRESWDSTWPQDINFAPFKEQVEWELDAQEKSNLIVMYFDKDTKSPITLLELGLFARSKKLIVCCPDGFWRKGNVDVTCEKYGIPQVSNLNELVDSINEFFKF